MAKGWMFGAKNIPCLTISGYVCNKYPLQRDIFCLEASLNVGPFGELWEKGWPFGLMKKKPQLLLTKGPCGPNFYVCVVYSSLRSSSTRLITPHINVLRSYFVCLLV
jgi:hypothetical protein